MMVEAVVVVAVDEGTVKKDGIQRQVTRGAPPSMASLEESLNAVKGPYDHKFGLEVDEEVVEKNGTKFFVSRGAPPAIATLEQSMNEGKGLYEEKYGDEV